MLALFTPKNLNTSSVLLAKRMVTKSVIYPSVPKSSTRLNFPLVKVDRNLAALSDKADTFP